MRTAPQEVQVTRDRRAAATSALSRVWPLATKIEEMKFQTIPFFLLSVIRYSYFFLNTVFNNFYILQNSCKMKEASKFENL